MKPKHVLFSLISIKNEFGSVPYPTRIEDLLTYNGTPITWACAKKMNEALHKLIPAIWA